MGKVYLIGSIIILFLFNSDIHRRQIRQGGYKIICYINNKKIKKINKFKHYFWVKSGEIHNSKGGVGGAVLDKTFLKYYKSNQLFEKGEFKLGLKNDVWKTWYENGNTKSEVSWKNGYRHGKVYLYSLTGDLEESGFYRKGKRDKKWINHFKKDTSYYDKGKVLKEKKKNLFFKIRKKVGNYFKSNKPLKN